MFAELTDAQATIFAAGISTLGALLALLIGVIWFGGRVKTLDGAIRESRILAEENRRMNENAQQQVGDLREKLSEALVQLESVSEVGNAALTALNSLASNMEIAGDIAPNTSENRGGAEPESYSEEAVERFKNAWKRIAFVVDSIISDPLIDGRTRAKYSRISKHYWPNLIDVVIEDGYILESENEPFLEAARLWESRKRNSSLISFDDAEKMSRFAELIERRNPDHSRQ